MSESEFESQSSAGVPANKTLEKGLRDAVSETFKTGKMEELTVKRVRLVTEHALGLDEGFFKSQTTWKSRSAEIIKNETESQERLMEQADEPLSSPPAKKKRSQPQKAKSSKRTSAETSQRTKKRLKKDRTPESLDNVSKSSLSEEGEEDIAARGMRQRSSTSNVNEPQKSEDLGADRDKDETGSPFADVPVEPRGAVGSKPSKSNEEEDNAGSESELSVLIDEEPKPKKQRKKNPPSTQDKKQKAKVGKQKEESNVDPDQAEIKRLQGWLIKCGIRKMWARELATYDTPKAKIKHLKQMLKDAGMEGRYSNEKANQIKEERELRADLEGVQEGERLWGTARSEEKDNQGGPPRRRLARGLKNFDFLSDDGEETD